ncbi:nuclear pore complex subunit [Teratosphaeriaceae sp. CCFEE 6253]|nr:nuclear pore complex subunit [Teratosphaeriaceae sp. CCFEE 6253]
MADLFSRLGPRDPPASGATSGTGLFGSATTNTQPTGASLFSQPTGASLFSQPASSAPSGEGLFGSAPAKRNLGDAPPLGSTAQNGSSNLFGAANTSTAQPAPTEASLFGAATSANTQPANTGANFFGNPKPATTGSSLFGAAAPAQSTNSLFASTANNNPQAQPNANASVFGSNVLPAQQSEPLIMRGYDPNAPPAQPAYFQALLDKGNKRLVDESNGLPQLQYGLQDIQRKVRNVGQGGPSAGLARGASNTRSQYLLAASGVNVGESLRDIESLMDTTSSARAAAVPEVPDYSAMSGVKDFLGQYHRNNFQEMIDNSLQRAQDDFNRMIDEQLHMQPVDWQRYRNRIDVHFGLRKPDEDGEGTTDGAMNPSGSFGRSRRSRMAGSSIFGLPNATKSVIGTPGPNGLRQSTFNDVAEKLPADGIRPAPEDRTQRAKQDKYSGKVKDLNIARIQEKMYPVLTRFAEVEAEPSNDDTSMLVNAYKALVHITGEHATIENASDGGAIKERQYADAYLDDALSSRRHGSIRKRIINGSRIFLESQFRSQLRTTVVKNPREANIGGVPTPVAEVKGYVRVRAARKELGPDTEILQEIHGDYCWAVIFYMLRAGLYEEVAQYLNENAAAFKQIDRKFTGYLRAYITNPERRLAPEMQTAISNEYSARQRLAPENSIDPYRMMCYKIIGRCDLHSRSLTSITNDMNDWLWLQFALAREYDKREELAHEAFGLNELQTSIKEVGDRYFGPGSDIAGAPMTYFFMQILVGQFEKAVADLYPHNYVSATHFAIALDFYGLLRVSGDLSNDDLLSYTTRQQPQIAFGSLIGLYTRDFRTANATTAVDYLTLICLNADLTGDIGKAQKELCYQALIEVVLETREFAQLLGDVRSDGQRIKGAVEQRLKLIKLDNEKEFLKHITLVAARTAEDQSRTTDAALLFHLADDYDKVIQVVNDAVSVYLTTELGETPARLTPLKPRSQQQNGVQPQDDRLSSLSLTAIDDPVELAFSMRGLYMSNDMYVTKIDADTLEITSRLLTLATARKNLEQNKWAEAIDDITAANLLPTNAAGNLSAIRARAQAFDQMPSVLARTIGHVMLWAVVACSNQVDKLRRAEFETGFQRDAIGRCVQMAKDIVVFAGLIRYRLPGRVWETLAQAGQDLGAY